MIYVDHDFYSNFTAAVKGNDATGQRDMLLTEIASVIVYDKQGAMELLRNTGIKINDAATDKQIVNACVKKMNDDKFKSGLAFLIAKRNDLISEKKSGLVPVIGDVVNGISNIFSSGNQANIAQQNAQAIEDTNRTALLMKVLELKGGAPQKSNTGKYILIGVISLAVVVGAVLLFRKKK